MKLTLEQRTKIMQMLEGKWKSRVCVFCGETGTYTVGQILELREYFRGSLVENSAVVPIIEVYCKSCSVINIFNLVTLGVIDPDTGKPLV